MASTGRRGLWLAAAPIAFVVVGLGAGCVYHQTYCQEDATLPGCKGTGGSTASGSTGTATSSTGMMTGCTPSVTDAPTADSCGVFVDPTNGVDSNPGTMAMPKKTLSAGVGAWTAGKAIYVCDGALSDVMGVTLPAGSVVYGGLDCGGGYKVKSASSRSTLAGAAGVIPLTLQTGAGKTEVHHLAVSAKGGTTAGSSAVGVVIGNIMADIEDVDVASGDGVDGVSSATPTDNIGPSDPTDSTIAGIGGAKANTTTPTVANPGAMAITNPLCPSISGSGGDGGKISGTPASASPGSAGSATPPPSGMAPNDGGGGQGDTGGGCSPGHQGANGDKAVDGAGAAGATSLGTIAADGYHGVAGTKGTDGNPGQGGGGGGGAEGSTTGPTRGASGGSGGAGGCGGKGAQGGGAGGSSIGFIVLGAVPTFVNVTISTGKGGDGGAGAAGEFGATGGNGGPGGNGTMLGLNNGCLGGGGGKGSNGGAGGGGHGGHSVGIAYVMSAPTAGFTVMKGVGGNAGTTAGTGAAADGGVSQETQKFAAQ